MENTLSTIPKFLQFDKSEQQYFDLYTATEDFAETRQAMNLWLEKNEIKLPEEEQEKKIEVLNSEKGISEFMKKAMAYEYSLFAMDLAVMDLQNPETKYDVIKKSWIRNEESPIHTHFDSIPGQIRKMKADKNEKQGKINRFSGAMALRDFFPEFYFAFNQSDYDLSTTMLAGLIGFTKVVYLNRKLELKGLVKNDVMKVLFASGYGETSKEKKDIQQLEYFYNVQKEDFYSKLYFPKKKLITKNPEKYANEFIDNLKDILKKRMTLNGYSWSSYTPEILTSMKHIAQTGIESEEEAQTGIRNAEGLMNMFRKKLEDVGIETDLQTGIFEKDKKNENGFKIRNPKILFPNSPSLD